MSEPMVTIKKADGTTERVPLSQVRKKKTASASAPPKNHPSGDNPKGQKKQSKPKHKPKKEEKKAPPPSSRKPAPPAPKEKKHAPPPPPPKKEMPKSEAPQPPKPSAPPAKKNAPLRAPAFPNMEKTFAAHDRQSPIKHAARKVMRTTQQPNISHAPKSRPAAPQWDTDDHTSLLDESLHSDVPAVIDKRNTELSTTAPVKDVFKDQAIATLSANAAPVKKAHEMKKGIPPMAPSPSAPKPMMPPRPAMSSAKPSMHDVRPGSARPAPGRVGTVAVPQPVKRSTGPVDELGDVTIEDFRRLGGNVLAMKEVFLSKFLGLRKESFMMYSDGVRAWRKSPLYQQYLNVISSSLTKRQPLDVVLSENGGLTKEEFETLVEVNMNLGM